MKDFILLLREDFDALDALSIDEMQELVESHMNWVKELVASGNFKAGDGLDKEGAVIASKSRLVTDGPYMEAREAIGGYYIIQAENLEQAVEISKGCPALEHNGSVEVRPIMVY